MSIQKLVDNFLLIIYYINQGKFTPAIGPSNQIPSYIYSSIFFIHNTPPFLKKLKIKINKTESLLAKQGFSPSKIKITSHP